MMHEGFNNKSLLTCSTIKGIQQSDTPRKKGYNRK